MGSTASNTDLPAPAEPERKSLVFRVGETLYACDIDLVREIVRISPMTRIPGAPPFVRGLLNVRGDILTVLDVGMRLAPEKVPVERGSVIVVALGERQAGLVVEEVIGVQAVATQPTPQEALSAPSDIARPMGHLDGRIVLYLDVPAFVSQSLV